jgi:hypothetical protein
MRPHCSPAAKIGCGGAISVFAFGANAAPEIRNNVFNYFGIADPTGTDGNISVDPLLIATNDFHLRLDSPCINAGDNGVLQSGWADLDGQPRLLGGRVDIGADEALVAFVTAQKSGAGPAQIHVDGPPGTNYMLQATSDFQSWAILKSSFAVPFDFSDANSTDYPHRFYRAVFGPQNIASDQGHWGIKEREQRRA